MHGVFNSYTGFRNAVRQNKLRNLTYFGIYLNSNQPVTVMEPLDLHKLLNLQFIHFENCYMGGRFERASSLSTLGIFLCNGLKGNLSSFSFDNFPQLTTLILFKLELNSTDLGNLAQANVKGYLPLLKHLDISCNKMTFSEFEYLFDGSCTWSELITLDIRWMFNDSEYEKVIYYMNEIVSRGYLPSIQTLGIDCFQIKNVHWNHLGRLLLNECENDALSNIADAVCWGYLPVFRTLCVCDFEGHDAEIVRTLSQLSVSCHQTYFFQDNFLSRYKCFCEI